jgi:hypothetical protein
MKSSLNSTCSDVDSELKSYSEYSKRPRSPPWEVFLFDRRQTQNQFLTEEYFEKPSRPRIFVKCVASYGVLSDGCEPVLKGSEAAPYPRPIGCGVFISTETCRASMI